MPHVKFRTSSGDQIYFKDNGDPEARYDILKLLIFGDGNIQEIKVGSFDKSGYDGDQLFVNNTINLLSPYYSEFAHSRCSEPCKPGFRKAKVEGAPSCCYTCVMCADGEMSNITDAQSCTKCSKYEKSNSGRTSCIPRDINYLSYDEHLGSTLSSISVTFSITCAVILGIFIKYRETPIVRANNRYLSCLLLISLMLCFLCTLLFIGRPTQICCLLRQVTFGIVFTISVSSVLAKTLTVIIAFNATKPGSKLKKYVGTQLAILLVIVCSLGEIIISMVWLASNPPFPEDDMLSDADNIILLCNEGSDCFFFCIIGYIGTLALLSLIAAFLAKDFPDRFNEAKNITFSMLGFCSVWGAFVPAYLSSKGSRMVAVEIFAILSSSAGLLGCIFIPKCYILFLRPELNTKANRII
ncbi:vomeronasal type-2 receptor 26-like [Xenopus tropicalis]|uniref:Vomeronasal type-2 receptor 26-like n=1 Tax=Xenopus tropicalis TaxID=8364 RepID=A0A8J1JPX8_XENTR|nr:vomeronasal type-2 receptor 26-like [Xenopus tropicalis]